MPDPGDEQDTTVQMARLADELSDIHRATYGVGAGSVTAHQIDGAVLVFLDELELLPSERFLIERGETDVVLGIRRRFQQAVGPTYIAAVERATGRRVGRFFSETSLDPDYSLEIFRLVPR